jgi:phospholipase/carboxylesterase
VTQQQLSLVHLVREPSVRTEAPPPLLLLLHGVGSYEGDLMALAPYLDGRFFVVSARAPITLGPGSYAWYHVNFSGDDRIVQDPEEGMRSRELILRFVQECVEAYALDPSQVYLMGFSQGAIMSLATVLHQPERFAGLVAMSGRVVPDLVRDMAPPERLAGLPVLVIHGTRDEVLPIHNGRGIRSMLEKLPVNLTYHEYDMAHQITGESLEEVTSWLAARLDEAAVSLRSS